MTSPARSPGGSSAEIACRSNRVAASPARAALAGSPRSRPRRGPSRTEPEPSATRPACPRRAPAMRRRRTPAAARRRSRATAPARGRRRSPPPRARACPSRTSDRPPARSPAVAAGAQEQRRQRLAQRRLADGLLGAAPVQRLARRVEADGAEIIDDPHEDPGVDAILAQFGAGRVADGPGDPLGAAPPMPDARPLAGRVDPDRVRRPAARHPSRAAARACRAARDATAWKAPIRTSTRPAPRRQRFARHTSGHPPRVVTPPGTAAGAAKPAASASSRRTGSRPGGAARKISRSGVSAIPGGRLPARRPIARRGAGCNPCRAAGARNRPGRCANTRPRC
jgi:hypothetical protein